MDDLVRHYFDAVPADRRELVDALHALVMRLYPHAVVDLSYRMPTYRVGEGWVAIANQKRHVSLYTCSAAHLEGFRTSHPHIRTGKGCINLKPSDRVDPAALEAVVRHAIEHPKG
ncbi:MAG: DUF1801 domain-containing protein [Planctomycetes bacterium]|nr:DUF1801 domain-containing protein [Planctomycetota bacterium]